MEVDENICVAICISGAVFMFETKHVTCEEQYRVFQQSVRGDCLYWPTNIEKGIFCFFMT